MDRTHSEDDAFMLELNRLLSCSSVGDPLVGSAEYYKMAESYALYGKELFDFLTNRKFPRPLDYKCVGEVSPFLSTLGNLDQLPGLGMQTLNNIQYRTQNMSNLLLMEQYLKTFRNQIQFNISLVQQHDYLLYFDQTETCYPAVAHSSSTSVLDIGSFHLSGSLSYSNGGGVDNN